MNTIFVSGSCSGAGGKMFIQNVSSDIKINFRHNTALFSMEKFIRHCLVIKQPKGHVSFYTCIWYQYLRI